MNNRLDKTIALIRGARLDWGHRKSEFLGRTAGVNYRITWLGIFEVRDITLRPCI